MSLLDDLRLERPFPITVATRLGSIIAVMNRENAATITSTGGAPDWYVDTSIA